MSSSSARRQSSEEGSSPPGSPAPGSTPTSGSSSPETSGQTPAQETADAMRKSNSSLGTDSESYLVAVDGQTAFTQNQREELRELEEAGSLSGEGTHQTTYVAGPTSSSEASPARTSPSPASDAASPAAAPASTGKSSGSSQGALFGPASFSSRMSPASFPLARVVDAASAESFYDGISDEAVQELLSATTPTSPPGDAPDARRPGRSGSGTPAPTSRWSAPRWGTSGTASATEYSTADTSESPSDGAACSSSLSSVLEPTVDRRYYLSPRAALGILSRAERRGKELPPHLRAALEDVVRTEPELWAQYEASAPTPATRTSQGL
jgi:hypothetical protein